MANNSVTPVPTRPAPDVPPPEPPGTPEKIPSFEQALARLSDIVEKLERGDLPLEESLTLFEKGIRLSRAAQTELERAERRVEELLAVDERGNPVVRELERG